MTTVYRVLAIVTTVVVVVQFFLAGLGAFHDYRTDKTDRFGAHETVGYIIVVLSLLILIAAILARLGGKAVGMSAGLLVMAGPIQILLAKAGTDHSEIWGAFHAFVGAGILGLLSTLIRLGQNP